MKTYTKDELVIIAQEVYKAEKEKYRDFNAKYYWEKIAERLN